MFWKIGLEIMKENNISPYSLSLQIGKSKGQVNKWMERGTIPPGDCLLRISKILNVRPEVFFPEDYPNLTEESQIHRKMVNWVDGMSDLELMALESMMGMLRVMGERLEEDQAAE